MGEAKAQFDRLLAAYNSAALGDPTLKDFFYKLAEITGNKHVRYVDVEDFWTRATIRTERREWWTPNNEYPNNIYMIYLYLSAVADSNSI